MPTAIHWVGDAMFVEGTDGTTSARLGVQARRHAGRPDRGARRQGPASRSRPQRLVLASSTRTRVAIAEQGFSTLTIYEVDTGKRAQARPQDAEAGPPARPTSSTRSGRSGDKVTDKCKESLEQELRRTWSVPTPSPAQELRSCCCAARGSASSRVLASARRSPRRRAIKLPWCEPRRRAQASVAPTAKLACSSASDSMRASARRDACCGQRADEIERGALLLCRSARRARGPGGCRRRRART